MYKLNKEILLIFLLTLKSLIFFNNSKFILFFSAFLCLTKVLVLDLVKFLIFLTSKCSVEELFEKIIIDSSFSLFISFNLLIQSKSKLIGE